MKIFELVNILVNTVVNNNTGLICVTLQWYQVLS